MVFILLIVLLSYITMELAFAQTAYQNADGERGTCIEMKHCPTLYSLFNSEPLSSLTIEFLRRSKCDFYEFKQLLCCVEPATAGQPIAEFNLKAHPKASLLPLDSCGLDRKREWDDSHVKLDEFPWTAVVKYRRGNNVLQFYCGGALITKRYVLTVAHCAKAVDHSRLVVRLGENDLDSDQDCEPDIFSGRLKCAPLPQDFHIEESISHPEHDQDSSDFHHDIALFRLDRDAKLDAEYVKPICLPTTAHVEIGKELLLTGWGATQMEQHGSVIKLKVGLPAMSYEECGRILLNESLNLLEGQLCAGGVGGKDSCKGDSGMPLMDWTESLYDGSRRYSVVGLVSYGIGYCGSSGLPGIYTKVFHYVPWILESIRP